MIVKKIFLLKHKNLFLFRRDLAKTTESIYSGWKDSVVMCSLAMPTTLGDVLLSFLLLMA